MRIFVSFENAVHGVNVKVGETVREIKELFQKKLGMNLRNSRNENDSVVSLMYRGTSLQDNWAYSDLGIPAGTILVCRVEKRIKPTLRVFCPRYEETTEYVESFHVWQTLVATLRVKIQNSTGVHVSAFRLYSPGGIHLFDCHSLKAYDLHAGDTVTMEIWHDVGDLVKAARENDITGTLQALASFHETPHLTRYQLQLGLFIAAHFGYHQLATQLMKCGARPDESVGQHPSRDWCRADAHPDHVKTPSHEAAQHGHLTCLHHFLMFNRSVLICKDAQGLTPCNVARKYKQTECFKLLIAEQFRIPTVNELSIDVYSRVRKWCDRARDRARLHKDKTTILLLTNPEIARRSAIVGQKIVVDGYNGKKADGSLKIHHDQRRPENLASASCSSRSNVNKHTSPTSEENHGRIVKREHSPSIAPASSVAKPKQNIGRQRKCPCRSAPVTNQNTRNVSVEQSVSSTSMSRTASTISGGEVAPAERNREGSKGRYVWKPLGATDGNEDEKKENPVVHEEGKNSATKSKSGNAGQGKHVVQENKSTHHKLGFHSGRSGKPSCRVKTKKTRSANGERYAREGLSTWGERGTKNLPIDTERRHSCDDYNGRSPSNKRSSKLTVASANNCLRVARDTFQKKNWLGQLQMALVINTNMCKRRHSHHEQRVEVPEPRDS